jgi:hypothetical protein
VIEYSEVEGYIESASTPTYRLGCDVGDGTLGGVMVDYLDEIKNPISRARKTLPLLSHHIYEPRSNR